MQAYKGRGSVIAVAVATMVMLQACGGADDGDAIQLQGVAAVGAPLVGARVAVQCAAGSQDGISTGSDGAWAITPSNGLALPCAIEVSGGRIGSASGAENTQRLHALAVAEGVANVTTLTSLQTAVLAGGSPSAWFARMKADPAALRAIGKEAPAAATAQLATLLPASVALPSGFDPVATAFTATSGNAIDGLLVKLGTAVSENNSSFADALDQAAAKLPVIDPTPNSVTLAKIAGFGGDLVDGKLADTHEIPAYDPLSKRLFVVNGSGTGTVEVWNIADPRNPVQVGTLRTESYGANLASVNSVTVSNGVVALAIQANPKTANGTVAFVNAADLSTLSTVGVGACPTCSPLRPTGATWWSPTRVSRTAMARPTPPIRKARSASSM